MSQAALPTTSATTTAPLPPEFDDMFQCFICYDTLKARPVMCPTCSKIGCEDCMRKWLETNNHHCPHCRTQLTSDKLVVCRFVDDLAKQVRDVMSATMRGSGGINGSVAGAGNEVCSEHGAPLFYYCHTCEDGICSDCAVLGIKHKDHSIKHLQTIYTHHRENVHKTIQSLFSHLQHLSQTQTVAETRLTSLHAAKQKLQNKHEKLLKSAQEHVESQFEVKAAVVRRFGASLESEVSRCRDTIADLQTHLKTSGRMGVVKKSRGVLAIVEREHPGVGKEGRGLVVPEVSCAFESLLVPRYESCFVRIEGFLARIASGCGGGDGVEAAVDVLYSEPFRASGIDWKLKVYCNGNKGAHLSIFMQMAEGVDSPSKYQYVIELVRKSESTLLDAESTPTRPSTPSPEPTIKSTREFVSEFSSGETWGYTKFYPLDRIRSSGFIDPADGSLEIKFSVRAMDYAQKCRDLQWRLDKVEDLPNGEGRRVAPVAGFEVDSSAVVVSRPLDAKSVSIGPDGTSSRPTTNPTPSTLPVIPQAAMNSSQAIATAAEEPPTRRPPAQPHLHRPLSIASESTTPRDENTILREKLGRLELARTHLETLRNERDLIHSQLVPQPVQQLSTRYPPLLQLRPGALTTRPSESGRPHTADDSLAGTRVPQNQIHRTLTPVDTYCPLNYSGRRVSPAGRRRIASSGDETREVPQRRFNLPPIVGIPTHSSVGPSVAVQPGRVAVEGGYTVVGHEREAVEEVEEDESSEEDQRLGRTAARRGVRSRDVADVHTDGDDAFLANAIREATRRIQSRLDVVGESSAEESDQNDPDAEEGLSFRERYRRDSSSGESSGSERDGDEVVRETLNRFIERLASVTVGEFAEGSSSRGSSRTPPRVVRHDILSHAAHYFSDDADEEDEGVDYEEMVDRIERRGRLAAMLSEDGRNPWSEHAFGGESD
ncbi:Tripartite motif containing 37 [Podochytrium sp. JEL0797]|nr:Tripartite motif containing 37 [Podochytrium sp. JEL0797]